MADIVLKARPLLGGAVVEAGGTRLAEMSLAMVSAAMPQGEEAAFEAGLAKLGLAMPSSVVGSDAGSVRALRLAPDQVMLLGEAGSEAGLMAAMSSAYVTRQTDAWVALSLSGPGAEAALERLVPLDFRSMPEGGFARTVMEHMSAVIVRVGGSDWVLLSASSSAKSFWHAVEVSIRYTS